MPAAVIGGNVRYASLGSIANLFRVLINDSFAGATNTPGEGLVMPNSNPDLLTIMNEGIYETYSDLRNIGDPALLLDNFILFGLPALTGPDPSVQVSLAYAGFFDGFQWHPEFTLPIGCERVERLWERLSGTNDVFAPMSQTSFGLPGTNQGQRMGLWEMRQNAIWMPGALVPIDLRIRCRITFPPYLDPTKIDFTTTYVPLTDCRNAIAAKMRIIYALRFAPEQYQTAVAEEDRQMGKLKLEVVRQQQSIENSRATYGDEATGDMTSTYWQL